MTLQKKATIVASTVATILVLIKLVIGILSGSAAVLASAIDSILDIAISMFNYFAISKAEKAPTEKFNYGLGKIEALAAVIEGTIITISGLFIFYKGVDNIWHQRQIAYLNDSIIVMIISIVLTGGLVLFLNHVYQKTKNMVVKSDALHYKTDLFSNSAVLLSLAIIYFTDWHWIDGVFGIAIALYIIKEAFELIKEGTLILLDVALDEQYVERIKQIITEQPEVTDYHYLRTRRSGDTNFVDVHVVFTPEISLLDAHRVSDKIEEEIKKLDPDSEWNITIHLDPYDDSPHND
ncbi:cation diffusion facilitator family transporter [Nitratiruptor sp. SB155-2]|uniref:cation diffusion facilitator family transporter n=1 Tax=Nitratiruptor sp. (strain SB155-2) TaxID=387092 RepID=UPI0001587359|nr:cation diffusion facilitator family transporter [Nitratiruptor sp. SB155-2]BAF70162.1 cation efflux protein [Nitratiruptor sp. SB155-2]